MHDGLAEGVEHRQRLTGDGEGIRQASARGQAERLGEIRADVLDRDPEPATHDLAVLEQAVHDRLRHVLFAGERMGVFARATCGSSNWAGYFAEGHMYVTNDLRIGPGAKNGAAGYKVAIDGRVVAEEMRVQLSGAWPDYVFDEDYELMSLEDLEEQIEDLGHLPGLPAAEDAESEGIMVGDMNRILLEKIEELTLHIIRLQKEIDELKKKREK